MNIRLSKRPFSSLFMHGFFALAIVFMAAFSAAKAQDVIPVDPGEGGGGGGLINPNSTVATPEPPRVLLDTTYPSMSGVTRHVPAGGNLQQAITEANPGDTITLEAGALYTPPAGSSFILPTKSNPNNLWIIIRAASSTFDAGGTTPPGTRVDGPSLAAAGLMPRLRTTENTLPAIIMVSGAHHWRLVGLDIGAVDGLPVVYNMITPDPSSYNPSGTMVSDIVIDRCYVHGNDTNIFRHGIALEGRRMAVIDSHVSNFHDTTTDSTAIYSQHGPGPFKIVNNSLEAAGENILFGGGDPAVDYIVPSDIEIQRNHIYKPLSRRYDPNYSVVKNLLELKNARRVLINGNLLEHNWIGSEQQGQAVLFTVRNQTGGAPWSVVEDVEFTNNIVRHSPKGINILSRDYAHQSQAVSRIRVHNNLFYNIGGTEGGGSWLTMSQPGARDLIFTHNTVEQTERAIDFQAYEHPDHHFKVTGFIFNDNIVRAHVIGGPHGGTIGTETLNYHALAPWEFRRNAIVGNNLPSYYPPDNPPPPANYESVGFVNRNGATYRAGDLSNYRLASYSPYRNQATDGSDIGVNQDEIDRAMRVPVSPLNLRIVANNGLTITLAWDDRSDNETSFIIESSAGATIDWTNPKPGYADLGAGVTSHTLSLPCDNWFNVRVRAVNQNGSSAWSNVVGTYGQNCGQ
jgi:hypothetical protein